MPASRKFIALISALTPVRHRLPPRFSFLELFDFCAFKIDGDCLRHIADDITMISLLSFAVNVYVMRLYYLSRTDALMVLAAREALPADAAAVGFEPDFLASYDGDYFTGFAFFNFSCTFLLFVFSGIFCFTFFARRVLS